MSGIGRACVRGSPLLSWLPGLVCLGVIDQSVSTCLGILGEVLQEMRGDWLGL